MTRERGRQHRLVSSHPIGTPALALVPVPPERTHGLLPVVLGPERPVERLDVLLQVRAGGGSGSVPPEGSHADWECECRLRITRKDKLK